MHFEQQFYIDSLVRHDAAFKLSRKFLKEEKLLNGINRIFTNYQIYAENAQLLAKKIKKVEGVKNAVNRIIDIIEQIV